MPKICSICLLPKKTRAAIDNALVAGTSYKKIASRFKKVSVTSLCRHRRHVLPKDLMRSRPAPQPEVALTLLQRVETLVTESRSIAEAAKTGQQWIAATSALREVRCCIELLGKLSGEISPANFNFNNFNFANLGDEQITAFLDALQKPSAARTLGRLTERMQQLGLRPPEVSINFVAVLERCPKCGYETIPGESQPLLEAPPLNGNGHA